MSKWYGLRLPQQISEDVLTLAIGNVNMNARRSNLQCDATLALHAATSGGGMFVGNERGDILPRNNFMNELGGRVGRTAVVESVDV